MKCKCKLDMEKHTQLSSIPVFTNMVGIGCNWVGQGRVVAAVMKVRTEL